MHTKQILSVKFCHLHLLSLQRSPFRYISIVMTGNATKCIAWCFKIHFCTLVERDLIMFLDFARAVTILHSQILRQFVRQEWHNNEAAPKRQRWRFYDPDKHLKRAHWYSLSVHWYSSSFVRPSNFSHSCIVSAFSQMFCSSVLIFLINYSNHFIFGVVKSFLGLTTLEPYPFRIA